MDERLLGTWTTDPTDVRSLREFGRVTLAFQEDGSLAYRLHQGTKAEQVVLFVFRTEKGVLYVDQPSSPREEATPYDFTVDGKLVVQSSTGTSIYVRQTVYDWRQELR